VNVVDSTVGKGEGLRDGRTVGALVGEINGNADDFTVGLQVGV
jgi:hypothetical protein